jgi:hypothetical protein
MLVINLVAPKAAAKQELLFNKLASGPSCFVSKQANAQPRNPHKRERLSTIDLFESAHFYTVNMIYLINKTSYPYEEMNGTKPSQ